jgi:hypothetical protein
MAEIPKPKSLARQWKKSELWAFRNVRGTKAKLLETIAAFRFPAKTDDDGKPIADPQPLPPEVATYLTWIINSRTSGEAFQMDCKADSSDGTDFMEHCQITKIF